MTSFDKVLLGIDAELAKQFPVVFESLRPGVSEASLDAFETKYGVSLPPALQALYRWHDGQEDDAPPLFGNLHFQTFDDLTAYAQGWLDAPDQLEEWEMERGECPSFPVGYIQEVYLRAFWLAFADGPSAESLCVDLEPDVRGTLGQVIVWGADFDGRYVLADGLETLMTALSKRLEAGEARLVGGRSGHWRLAQFRWDDRDGSASFVRDIFSGWGAVLPG